MDNWLVQGVISNAVYGIIVFIVVIVFTVLKKQESAWLSPLMYGLIGGTLTVTILYSGTLYAKWPLATGLLLGFILLAAASIHLVATYLDRKPFEITRIDDSLDGSVGLDPSRVKYLLTVVNHQAESIDRWVTVDRCDINLHDLSRYDAYIEFMFYITNGSVFNVTLNIRSYSEAIFFGKRQLAFSVREKEEPGEIRFGSSGILVIQQSLNREDVKHILGGAGGFTFPRLEIEIHANEPFEDIVKVRRLNLAGVEVNNQDLLTAYGKSSD